MWPEPGCCLRSPSGWGPQGPRGGLLPSSELAPPALPFPPLLQPGCGRGRSLGPAEGPGMEMSCESPAGRCSGSAPRAGGRRDQVHEHPERLGAGSRGVWSVCGDGTTHPGPTGGSTGGRSPRHWAGGAPLCRAVRPKAPELGRLGLSGRPRRKEGRRPPEWEDEATPRLHRVWGGRGKKPSEPVA